jgi:hypothetical protein
MQTHTHTIPSLQGTLAKPAMPTLKPDFAKEPFSPSRSNAGQRDNAAKNRLIYEPKYGQLVTAYHCACGGDVVFEGSELLITFTTG